MDVTDTAFCPRYHKAVELIGKRWTGAILRAMLLDVTRFADLREVVPGLSDRMLTERLKELQEEGIVERIVHPETRCGSSTGSPRRGASCTTPCTP